MTRIFLQNKIKVVVVVVVHVVLGKYQTARYWDWEWVPFDQTGTIKKSGPPRIFYSIFFSKLFWLDHSVLKQNFRKFRFSRSRPFWLMVSIFLVKSCCVVHFPTSKVTCMTRIFFKLMSLQIHSIIELLHWL